MSSKSKETQRSGGIHRHTRPYTAVAARRPPTHSGVRIALFAAHPTCARGGRGNDEREEWGLQPFVLPSFTVNVVAGRTRPRNHTVGVHH